MSRYFVFYLFACIVLFVSLTGLLAALNVHTHFVEVTDESKQPEANSEVVEQEPPFTLEEYAVYRGSAADISAPPPPLMAKYLYVAPHPIPIYDSNDFATARVETLPTNGVFELLTSRFQKDQWIHSILVSNGRENYYMFMKHKDAGAPTFYGDGPPPHKLDEFTKRTERFEVKQTQRREQLQTEYAAAVDRYWQAESLKNPKNPFRESVKNAQARLARMDNGRILFAAMIAGVITLLTAFFLGTISYLRASRVWESDFGFDDISNESEELDENEVDAVPEEESDAQDGVDHRLF